MNFILYTKSFEYILYFLIIINAPILIALDNKQEKEKNSLKNNSNLDQIFKYKINIILIYTVIIIALTYIKYKSQLFSFLIIATTIIAFIISVLKILKDQNPYSLENNITFVTSTLFYLIFFSNNATKIYIDNLININHFSKELLLYIYINIRLFLFAFYFFINLYILFKNVINIIKKNIFYTKIKNKIDFSFYKINLYDFYFYKLFQNKITLIIDFVISLLFDGIFLIISLILILIKIIIKKIINILENSNEILDSWSDKSKKYIKVSLIISLVTTYIIITFNSFFTSSNLKDIYNLISTVIVIPIIFESINSHK